MIQPILQNNHKRKLYSNVNQCGYLLNLSTCIDKYVPAGSVGEESTCNAGDLGSIPGLGRSPGGGHRNPLQGFGGKEGWGLSLANDQVCSSQACRAWAIVSFLGTLLERIFLEHMSSASQW